MRGSYWVSHGGIGSLRFGSVSVPAPAVCEELGKVAAKGVPICLLVDACHGVSLFDRHNWNFPAGSVIITSSGYDETAFGSAVPSTNSVYGLVTNALFTHAFSSCLNDTNADANADGFVDDVEAFDWVLERKPCYSLTEGNFPRYPAGPPEGASGDNPEPARREIGRNPEYSSVPLCNATGQDKTDFHIVYQGNVTNATARVWRGDSRGRIDRAWGTNRTTLRYDPTNDVTLVSHEAPDDPLEPGEHINGIVSRAEGGLRPVRQYWTPTPVPAALPDRVPTRQASIRPNRDQRELVLQVLSGYEAVDGMTSGETARIRYRFSPAPVPPEHLNLGDALVTQLPPVDLGTHLLSPEGTYEWVIPVPSLPPGTNPTFILEVESTWDLNLTTVTELAQFTLPPLPPPGPRLEIRLEGGLVFLTWDESAGILDEAVDVRGPWSPMFSAGSPLVISPGMGGRGFYRLFPTSGARPPEGATSLP